MSASYFNSKNSFAHPKQTLVEMIFKLIYYLLILLLQITHVKGLEESSRNENKLEHYLCMLKNHNKM